MTSQTPSVTDAPIVPPSTSASWTSTLDVDLLQRVLVERFPWWKDDPGHAVAIAEAYAALRASVIRGEPRVAELPRGDRSSLVMARQLLVGFILNDLVTTDEKRAALHSAAATLYESAALSLRALEAEL